MSVFNDGTQDLTIKDAEARDMIGQISTPPVMGASGSTHASGLTPDTPSTAGTTKYLREDGSWQTPPNTEYVFNTAYNASTNKAATMSDIPSSLPANGGNSATVNNHSVNKDVPADAVFTDNNTTYKFTIGSTTKGDVNGTDLGTLKSETAASGDNTLSLCTTGEKYTWNGKQASVAALGSTTKPVYTSAAGTFAECSNYAGGTAVTLNGTSKGGDSASFYAPTSAGTSGYYLKSSGSGAPTWTAFPTIPSKMSDVASISVTAISADTSSSCSITGSGNDGKSQTIIYTNSSGSDKTVTVPTTYKTPDGAAIELTCPNGGYCEVNYLNISGTIYARGL